MSFCAMSSDQESVLTLYGIKNCDSCRKAVSWLKHRGLPFVFHDIRDDGLDEPTLMAWLDSPHAPKLLNKRSTTWRQLTDEQRHTAMSEPVSLLLEYPTLIKRPVITDGRSVLDVGFSAARLDAIL
jgi:arsenate reductase